MNFVRLGPEASSGGGELGNPGSAEPIPVKGPSFTQLKALASLTPRERLRLELSDRWGAMADNLDEALAEGNGEKAVRLYWDLVDQAYGKTAQRLALKAGPLGDLSEVPTEELERRLAELRGSLELPETAG